MMDKMEEQEDRKKDELSEKELDAVAGGMITPYETSVVNTSGCDIDF
jgi:bacteriocin-like protein